MMETICTKFDCFFRVKDMCCNLCAEGKDPCLLYWPADKKPEIKDEKAPPSPAGAPSINSFLSPAP
ncbi:MAG: hypothetical protein A3G18_00370 [Rhodospirillales bacterium RIFCSPLOWO2_12_FULL_58_28]|nr:MAG: hypothetical protein A3H92_02975 [Rhodospirillales bacterium RIFCSPLOWO2_02_FULL_58_16]OHC79919.1 MAG: hypothetical protein A3G18_00370 [Rhodospirillales bacterium RIFCSPLOWO2_12_FULL_58_28]